VKSTKAAMDGFQLNYGAGIRVLSRDEGVEIEESTDGISC
jgi:hypothetical protein